MDVIEAIHGRRTLGRWLERPVPREMIETLLAAAVTAPNHHNTAPWRFFVITGAGRERFGDVLADAVIRRNPEMEIEKLKALAAAERAKPLRAPALIVIACKHADNPRVVAIEDLQACAAATQNLLLGAHSLGLAAAWKTGDGVYDTLVKSHFGLAKDDVITGVIYLGYADDDAALAVKPRDRSVAAVTEWRN